VAPGAARADAAADLGPDLITAFIYETVETMRGLEPALIFFSQPEPEAAMRKLFERRGVVWTLWHLTNFDPSGFARARRVSGVDGLLTYWREPSDRAERPRLRVRPLPRASRRGDGGQ
jgi:hypothetical protein